jgi:hypothetical protein
MVVMDGQGNLNNQAIKSVLKLTNITIINFSLPDFNDYEALTDLDNKVDIIKQSDPEICIILLVRDANKSEAFKGDLLNFVT